MSSKKRVCKNNRHPTGKKVSKPTHSHTYVSLTDEQLKLLRMLNSSKDGERFNVKRHAINIGIARTTIIDRLNTLKSKNLVTHRTADWGISDFGKKTLDYFDGGKRGVGTLRKGCRTPGHNLSLHATKYVMAITDRRDFSVSKLKGLGVPWKHLRLPNLIIYYAYFDNMTLVIQPKKVTIRVHDVVAEDAEAALFESFNHAIRSVKILEKLGIHGKSFELEKSHWSRVTSLFAEALQRIDKRFSLELHDGRKFYIDYSTGPNPEDETEDMKSRERIDKYTGSILDSKSTPLDVDKMIEITGNLVKLEVLKASDHTNTNMPASKPGNIPEYLG